MATLNGKEIFPELTHIKISNINQNGTENEEDVDSKLIELLYTLAYKSSYVQNKIVFSDSHDDFSGILNVPASYSDYITYLTEPNQNNNHFADHLRIRATNTYILFKDSLVEEIIVNSSWYGRLGYTGVIKDILINQSTSDSANDAGFQKIFRNNTSITSFDELIQLTYGTFIGPHDFQGCTNLTSINLTKVTFIGTYAFYKSGLEWFNGTQENDDEKGTLYLQYLSEEGLRQGAFEWADNVGPKIKKIMSLGRCNKLLPGAFRKNTVLEYISDSSLSNMLDIGTAAFEGCSRLVIDDLKLPNASTIGDEAFMGTQVRNISELKSSVIIKRNAFQNCKSLLSISEWSVEDNDEDPEKTVALQNIKEIGSYAFNGCTSLTINDLKLPLLTSIGTGAFGSTNVKKVSNLGNSLTKIQGFNNCTSLTSVVIPSTVDTFGENAFNGCSSLKLPDISRFSVFENSCCASLTSLAPIAYLPKVNTCIGYKSFADSSVRCLYLPNARHTRGPYGKNSPTPLANQHRGNDNRFNIGLSPSIFYFKNLEEVALGVFSGQVRSDIICCSKTKNDITQNEEYYRIYDSTKLSMFNNDIPERGGKKFPINSSKSMGEPQMGFSDVKFANIKFLIINNITPPISYFAYNTYGNHIFGSLSLWGTNDTQSSFKYLVVPRSAINIYKTWSALKPNIDTSCLSSSELSTINRLSTFDINNIIALESMPHVATKDAWDAIPDDDVHKYDYLIEEYMGLSGGETINWDSQPTFRE